MTANDSKNEKMEETLGTKKVESSEVNGAENQTQVPKDKLVNDDYQVVTDDRGYYSLAEGKWLVKVKRVSLREVIAGWNVIYPVFGDKESKGLNLKKADTWLQMFSLATAIQPGVFYNFLLLLLEPLYENDETNKEVFKKEVDEFHKYIRRNLMPEEMRDIVYILFKQEEKRFEELIGTVKKMFAPMINKMMGQGK